MAKRKRNRKNKPGNPKGPVYHQMAGLNCIEAKLLGGVYDGCTSIASHGALIFEGEHYCHVEYNGDEEDVFRHSRTFLEANTPGGIEQMRAERAKVEAWNAASIKEVLAGRPPVPSATLIPMPMTRIGVHWQMVRLGVDLEPDQEYG